MPQRNSPRSSPERNPDARRTREPGLGLRAGRERRTRPLCAVGALAIASVSALARCVGAADRRLGLRADDLRVPEQAPHNHWLGSPAASPRSVGDARPTARYCRLLAVNNRDSLAPDSGPDWDLTGTRLGTRLGTARDPTRDTGRGPVTRLCAAGPLREKRAKFASACRLRNHGAKTGVPSRRRIRPGSAKRTRRDLYSPEPGFRRPSTATSLGHGGNRDEAAGGSQP
jgi:hypothetical protein